jgi:hypothetical protein
MIIYKCRFSGDEMLSDAFKPVPVKDEDGNEVPGLIQIQSQKVSKVCDQRALWLRHLVLMKRLCRLHGDACTNRSAAVIQFPNYWFDGAFAH